MRKDSSAEPRSGDQIPGRAGVPAWGVFAAAAAIAAIWSMHAGKDLSWDLLHYHYYAAHALFEGRLERDFFAASAQGYLNPVGFVPFYWMVSSGWHSVAVSTVLAAAHAANIALLYALAQRLFAHHEACNRAILSLLAAALGAASAVFWATVGTSFLEPMLTVPMLGGVLLLAGEGSAGMTGRVAWAGFLFGAAAALKYSNAMFALAAALLAVSLPAAGVAARMRALLAYAAGGAVGTALMGGATFAHLYREYGNPVFPLFNAWFRAPDFPPINIGAERFAPRSFEEAVFFPFRIVSPEGMTYAEISAPDLRFAALIALAAAVGAAALWRRAGGPGAPGGTLTGLDLRLLAFFALAYAAWLAASANGRYGMLVILLVGLLVARFADRLLPVAGARGALLILLIAQVVACALISPMRWFMADLWSERWFPYQAPERAQREPALYLSVETQAMSVVVPLLHPQSSFINLRGEHSVQHGAKRMQALLARHQGRVRTIGRALRLQRDGRPRPGIIEAYDSTLLRYGFRVDAEDCFAIAWRPERHDALSQFANLLVTESAGVPESNAALVSCALRPGSWSAAEIRQERRMSALFDRMEHICRGIFRDQTAVTEKLGAEWSRSYAGLEARLETNQGALILVPYFRLRNHYLGTAGDWDQGVPALLEKPCREGLPR
jgi:hypothetical protein